MVQPQWVEYIRANKDKYPVATLKKALMDAGASAQEADEAAELAFSPSPAPAAAPPPPAPPTPAESASAPKTAQAAPKASGPVDPRAVLEAYIPQAKSILLEPITYFRSMPKSGGYKEPLIFLLATAAAGAALLAAVGLMFGLLHPVRAVIGAIISMIAFPLFFIFFSFIGAAFAYVFWKLLGSKEDYETAFRCVAYASAASPLISAFSPIPYLGGLVRLVSIGYWVYLSIIISTEVHGIDKKKATIACAILGGLSFLLTASAMIVAFLARR